MINVFVIDDHPMFVDGIKAVLKKNSHSINISGFAFNSDDAIDKISKNHTDIILFDLSLPGIKGLHLFLQLQQRFPNIKCIALSEINDHSLHEKLFEKGIRAVLLKSCSLEEFKQTIFDVAGECRKKCKRNSIP